MRALAILAFMLVVQRPAQATEDIDDLILECAVLADIAKVIWTPTNNDALFDRAYKLMIEDGSSDFRAGYGFRLVVEVTEQNLQRLAQIENTTPWQLAREAFLLKDCGRIQ